MLGVEPPEMLGVTTSSDFNWTGEEMDGEGSLMGRMVLAWPPVCHALAAAR
jgi:hypothetical protein